MDRKTWLSLRKIGSSDAPAIMGVSSYDTPYSLYIKKITKMETPDNFAMRRGREREEPARKEFERMTGLIMPAKNNVQSQQYEFMTANFDGMNFEGTELVEIKNVKKEYHQMALNGKVPDEYWPQVQHQLVVAELDRMRYFSYHDVSGAIVHVHRDEAYIKELIEAERIFWDCLQNQTPPPMCDRDYRQRDDKEWEKVAERWKQAQEELKKVEEEEAELRAQLISLAQGQNAKGCGVSYQRVPEKGRVDYRNIPELKLIDLDIYRKAPIVKNVLRLY